MNATRRHATTEGSFARSASSAAGRGLFLIAIAVLIGVLLLRNAFDEDSGFVDTGGSSQTSTTAEESSDTTTASTTPGDTAATTTPGATPASTHPPNEVKVLVANAAGVSGAAGRATDTLSAAGFAPLEPGNAGTRVEATIVYVVPGYEGDGAAIAAALGAPATVVQPMPDPAPVDAQGAQVLVMLGTDVATTA